MKKIITIASLLLASASLPASADTLTQALSSGLLKSDSLNAARQNYVAVRESVTIAQSGNDLSGTVTVSGSQTESDKKNASGGFQSSQAFSAKIGISKQLYDSGEAEARVTAANYNIASAKANYRALEQATILSVIDAYLTLLTSAESRALQEENVARLTAQTQATQIRLDAGTTTATRLAEANARLARAQSNLITAIANEETARETYQSLTGLSGDDLSLPTMMGTLPSTLAEAETRAVANHPDMVAAQSNERAARTQFDILARQVLPKVKFSLSATDSQAKGTMQDKLDIKGEVTLTSPFIVTPSSRAKGKETAAKLERAKYQLADTRRKIALDARSALRSLKAANAQSEAVDVELEAAELVAEGIRAEVEFGQKIFLDQLDAEQSVSDAKVRKIQAQQSIMINHFRLLASMGELDSELLGVTDVLPSLESEPSPRDVFTGLLPLADLPE